MLVYCGRQGKRARGCRAPREEGRRGCWALLLLPWLEGECAGSARLRLALRGLPEVCSLTSCKDGEACQGCWISAAAGVCCRRVQGCVRCRYARPARGEVAAVDQARGDGVAFCVGGWIGGKIRFRVKVKKVIKRLYL